MARTGRPPSANPGYQARHLRVRTARGKASAYPCDTGCGKPGRDWALIHDADPLDVMSYRPMCHKCHFAYDRAGVAHTPEHRAAISQASMGKAGTWTGRSHSAESVEKMRQAAARRKRGPDGTYLPRT